MIKIQSKKNSLKDRRENGDLKGEADYRKNLLENNILRNIASDADRKIAEKKARDLEKKINRDRDKEKSYELALPEISKISRPKYGSTRPIPRPSEKLRAYPHGVEPSKETLKVLAKTKIPTNNSTGKAQDQIKKFKETLTKVELIKNKDVDVDVLKASVKETKNQATASAYKFIGLGTVSKNPTRTIYNEDGTLRSMNTEESKKLREKLARRAQFTKYVSKLKTQQYEINNNNKVEIAKAKATVAHYKNIL